MNIYLEHTDKKMDSIVIIVKSLVSIEKCICINLTEN